MKPCDVPWLCLWGFGLLAGCSPSKTTPNAPEGQAVQSHLAQMGLEAQRRAGVVTGPAGSEDLVEYLQVTGTVQPIDSHVSDVRPLARGRVLKVQVRIGDRVAHGQPLAEFDNMEAGELVSHLAAARADLQRLKIQLAAQKLQTERNKDLVDAGAAPRKQYELSRAEQQALDESIRSQESTVRGLTARLQRFGVEEGQPDPLVTTTIRAPFAGVVTAVKTAPGETVSPETMLFTVADLSEVWVQAEVFEKDLGRVRLGQSAIITVDTYPGERFTGKVTYLSDILDKQTRTARVRCELTNIGSRLKLDMFAAVQLPTNFSRRAIAVPADAIQQLDGGAVVFVRQAQTQFEARRVRAGKTVNGLTEILDGIREGDEIVREGSFHLKSIIAGKQLGEE